MKKKKEVSKRSIPTVPSQLTRATVSCPFPHRWFIKNAYDKQFECFLNGCDVAVLLYALIFSFVCFLLFFSMVFVMNKCLCCTVSVACSSVLIKATQYVQFCVKRFYVQVPGRYWLSGKESGFELIFQMSKHQNM